MKRHNVTALLLALALTLAVPGAALARAEVVGASGLGCCVDLGVRYEPQSRRYVHTRLGRVRGCRDWPAEHRALGAC